MSGFLDWMSQNPMGAFWVTFGVVTVIFACIAAPMWPPKP